MLGFLFERKWEVSDIYAYHDCNHSCFAKTQTN